MYFTNIYNFFLMHTVAVIALSLVLRLVYLLTKLKDLMLHIW